MNQFDQEIRDKINNKSYEYQPQAWKAFKQKSGMPMMSIGVKSGLLCGIAAAIVGGVLYFTLSSGSDQQTPESITHNTQQTDNKPDNTINPTENTGLNDTLEQIFEASHPIPAAPQSQPKPQDKISTEATAKETTESSNSVKPQPKPIHTYGRPLEILVDTISSIDFPDYKPQPADMLP